MLGSHRYQRKVENARLKGDMAVKNRGRLMQKQGEKMGKEIIIVENVKSGNREAEGRKRNETAAETAGVPLQWM